MMYQIIQTFTQYKINIFFYDSVPVQCFLSVHFRLANTKIILSRKLPKNVLYLNSTKTSTKSTFQGTFPLSSDSPPPQPLKFTKKKSLLILYKYFFRACTQSGVIIQQNGFNKKGFSGHVFLKFEKFLAGGGSTCPLKSKKATPLIVMK